MTESITPDIATLAQTLIDARSTADAAQAALVEANNAVADASLAFDTAYKAGVPSGLDPSDYIAVISAIPMIVPVMPGYYMPTT